MEVQTDTQQLGADYGEFIRMCADRNITRSSAYAFLRAGLFDGYTFKIGPKRFLYAAGLAALPARVAAYEAAKKVAA